MGSSQVAPVVKNPPDNAGDTGGWDRSLGREAPLEEIMATHSSILAWKILWTEEPGGLQSTASQRVRHDWSNLAHVHRYMGKVKTTRTQEKPNHGPVDTIAPVGESHFCTNVKISTKKKEKAKGVEGAHLKSPRQSEWAPYPCVSEWIKGKEELFTEQWHEAWVLLLPSDAKKRSFPLYI